MLVGKSSTDSLIAGTARHLEPPLRPESPAMKSNSGAHEKKEFNTLPSGGPPLPVAPEGEKRMVASVGENGGVSGNVGQLEYEEKDLEGRLGNRGVNSRGGGRECGSRIKGEVKGKGGERWRVGGNDTGVEGEHDIERTEIGARGGRRGRGGKEGTEQLRGG